MLDKILLDLSGAIRGGGVMLPLIALLGGFLTSLTPCSLSSLPIIITYLGAGKKLDTAGAFKISLTYAIGNGVTLVALGVIAALLGRLVNFAGRWWYLFLGVLMILMALQLFGVIDVFGKLQQSGRRFEQKKGGAFVLGLLSGFFASPCATPVMIALMAMIGGTGSGIMTGILLFLLYAIGHGISVVAVGTSLGKFSFIQSGEGYQKFSVIINYIFGILVLGLGLYMLYLGF